MNKTVYVGVAGYKYVPVDQQKMFNPNSASSGIVVRSGNKIFVFAESGISLWCECESIDEAKEKYKKIKSWKSAQTTLKK